MLFFEFYFDVHVFWDVDAHHVAQRPFVAFDVNQPLVDPHLPTLEGFASPAARTLSNGNHHLLGWQRNFSGVLYARSLRHFHDLVAHALECRIVRAAQFDARFLHGLPLPACVYWKRNDD